jgi:radical SAM superfamily enzyme YgiQ (UPF0313 family)
MEEKYKGRHIFPYPSMAVVAEPTNYIPGPTIFRPPLEAFSLILQGTIGCPWNRCIFCSIHKHKRFRPRVDEVKEDIEIAKKFYADKPRRVFLADANSIVLRTDKLIEIIDLCFQTFPHLERVSTYAGARFIIRKGFKELQALQEAGLHKVYVGVESGDDELLTYMQKGVTTSEMLEAGKIVKDAEMELSITLIQGLGGENSWKRNAGLTAQLLNEMQPHETRLHFLRVSPNTPLHDKVLEGDFTIASQKEVMQETREFVSLLEYDTQIYFYTSSFLPPGVIDGHLPNDKGYILEILDSVLRSRG